MLNSEKILGVQIFIILFSVLAGYMMMNHAVGTCLKQYAVRS